MARFDVFPNSGALAAQVPFLLDVQSDLLNGLQSRVVVPLRRLDSFPTVPLPERLTPVLEVQGQCFLMETPKLAAVSLHVLKEPTCSLRTEQDRILLALDFVFQGY